MPNTGLPIVKTFTIPSLEWTVTDLRNLDFFTKTQAMERFIAVVLKNTGDQGIDQADILCEFAVPRQQNDFEVGYATAYLKQPTLTRERRQQTHPLEKFRFHTGRENPAPLMSVTMRGRIIGGIYIATFMIEEDTPRKLTARSMLWVGVEPIRGREELDVWMDAITFMIDNDLELEDGRVLDFVGYDFISDQHMRDGMAERTGLVDFLGRMAAYYDDNSGPPDAAGDISFRRLVATARPAERP